MEQKDQPISVLPGHIHPGEEPVEEHENAIQQMREWLSQIYPPSQVDRALKIDKVVKNDKTVPPPYWRLQDELDLTVKIWTFTNQYRITARIHGYGNRTYLGCQASSRKSRTGETWTRGNDLPDGEFNQETWDKIMGGIVRYEAEEVRSDKWKKGA